MANEIIILDRLGQYKNLHDGLLEYTTNSEIDELFISIVGSPSTQVTPEINGGHVSLSNIV